MSIEKKVNLFFSTKIQYR